MESSQNVSQFYFPVNECIVQESLFLLALCSPLYIATVVANPGCKESQIYSLPFGQAVASMYLSLKSF